jgi:molybdenum cofactor cytidylyltransferase
VVLAAGGSTRFGGPKQLIDWFGQPMVRHAAKTALAAGLDPVVVVLGAHAEEVRGALAGLPVRVVENADWAAGQSTSLIAGVKALPAETGGAIFLLSDQPQVPERLLSTLVEMHCQSQALVVAPQAGGRRANPVLFDRRTFADLLGLTGDVGGRAIFSKYRISWVEWQDDRLVMDIDTPEDYERLLRSMQAYDK